MLAVVNDHAVLLGAEQHLAGRERQNRGELPVSGLGRPYLTEPAFAEDDQTFSRGCNIQLRLPAAGAHRQSAQWRGRQFQPGPETALEGAL
jgi:hypothetical protein